MGPQRITSEDCSLPRDFPGGPVVKNLPCNAEDAGSILGWGTKILHAVGQQTMDRRRSPVHGRRCQVSQLRPKAVKVKSQSRVRLFATPRTNVAHQAPPSMGFSRQEYCSGLPFPSPGDLPDPGIKPGSPALQADALTSEPPGKPT